MTEQQITVPIAQVHAVPSTKAEVFTIGTLAILDQIYKGHRLVQKLYLP